MTVAPAALSVDDQTARRVKRGEKACIRLVTGETEVAAAAAIPERARPFRPAPPHAPLPAEIERHRAFLARIVNPLWERFAVAN